MALMIDVESGPAAEPEDPRRVLRDDLLAETGGILAHLRQLYETAARRADGPLRDVFAELAARKAAQASALAAAGAPPGRDAEVSTPGVPAGAGVRWGLVLGEAFAGERALGLAARQLGAFSPDPTLRELARSLAEGAARDLVVVRKLYLRYS